MVLIETVGQKTKIRDAKTWRPKIQESEKQRNTRKRDFDTHSKRLRDFEIGIKNLVGKHLDWVLARRARKERKLLARRKNLLVPDDRTGVFSSPAMIESEMMILFLTYVY